MEWEIENGRVVKNGYGVFDLAWQAEEHPEWSATISAELDEIRAGIRAAHSVAIKFLIWAGMGGSAEDKAMYQAVGLLRRGPRLYLLDSTDPVKLDSILADMKKRSGLSDADMLRRTLVVGMAMGMTSYEPVLNLQKLAALYDAAGVDSRANFYYMTFPGSLLDQFAAKRGYRRVPLQLDEANTTAGRHSAPMNRGSLYALGLAGVDLRAWIEATFLTAEEVSVAWRLAAFLHIQGLNARDKVTLLLPRGWAGAALWTKQAFEESLGKSTEYGLKIVCFGARPAHELSRAVRNPSQIVFWCLQMKKRLQRQRGKNRAAAARRLSRCRAHRARRHSAFALHAVRSLCGVRIGMAAKNQFRDAAERGVIQIHHQQVVRGIRTLRRHRKNQGVASDRGILAQIHLAAAA